MFSAARLRLTLWYLAVLGTIVVLLSVALYEVLLRLQQAEALALERIMRIDDLELDTVARQVRRGGRDVALSAREYALLEYLVHHAGQILTREQLAAHVWSDAEVESNVIDVYVRYLRQKVDAPFGEPLIHTVRGIGYTLRAP